MFLLLRLIFLCFFICFHFLKGNILENSLIDGIIVANQSLVLQNVSRQRGGIYTCVGSNREGDGESNPVHLDIRCKSSKKSRKMAKTLLFLCLAFSLVVVESAISFSSGYKVMSCYFSLLGLSI